MNYSELGVASRRRAEREKNTGKSLIKDKNYLFCWNFRLAWLVKRV